MVAQATSATADAAAWGPLHQELRARRQQQQQGRPQPPQPLQQQQQQQHGVQAAAFGAGRVGVTQQLEASTSGRPPLPLDVPATAGNSVSGLAAAAAPYVARRPLPHRTVSHAIRPPSQAPSGVEIRFFTLGAIAAVALHYLVNFTGTLPVVRSLVQRFVWWHEPKEPSLPPTREEEGARRGRGGGSGGPGGTTALVQYSEDEESVEWVNMCWRKVGAGGRAGGWVVGLGGCGATAALGGGFSPDAASNPPAHVAPRQPAMPPCLLACHLAPRPCLPAAPPLHLAAAARPHLHSPLSRALPAAGVAGVPARHRALAGRPAAAAVRHAGGAEDGAQFRAGGGRAAHCWCVWRVVGAPQTPLPSAARCQLLLMPRDTHHHHNNHKHECTPHRPPAHPQRLRIMEFTLDHEAPYFTNMRRRTSRKVRPTWDETNGEQQGQT